MTRDIDAGSFWRAIAMRAVGAAVITATDAQGPAGFLALSATHLSASPPMIMASVSATTSALPVIRASGHFAVNYLARGDEELAEIFGGKRALKGADRFDAALWTHLATGAPVLRNALGVLECRLEEALERFGSWIIIGRLVNFARRDGAGPLVSFDGGYL